MMSDSIKRWTLSISTAAIAATGVFGTSSSAVAAPACTPGAPLEGSLGAVPAAAAGVQVRADNASVSITNPDVRLLNTSNPLRRFNTVANPPTYEFRARQTSNLSTAVPGFLCQIEVDVLVNSLTNPTTIIGVDEVEQQLATVAELPAVVSNRLNATLAPAHFRPYFIELSRRYSPPRPFTTNGPTAPANSVVYEIEGVCTSNIPATTTPPNPGCTVGQDIEIQINSDGTLRNISPAT